MIDNMLNKNIATASIVTRVKANMILFNFFSCFLIRANSGSSKFKPWLKLIVIFQV